MPALALAQPELVADAGVGPRNANEAPQVALDAGREASLAEINEPTVATTIVTATRSVARLSESPVATEVMTRRQILETGARDVAEALQARSGIELFPSLGGTQVRMQGLGPEYTLVVVDGQRATGRVNGALDISRYSVEDIEQLEIVKGPSSVLWGSDALAGVLHLVTRLPRRPFGINALFSYGFLNQLDGRISSEVSSGLWGARGSFAFGQRDAFDLDPSTPATSGSSFRSFQGSVRGTYGKLDDGPFVDVRAAGVSRVQRGVDSNLTGAVFDRAAGDVLGEASARLLTDVGRGRLSLSAGLNLWTRRFVLDQRGASELDQLQDAADHNALVTATYDLIFHTHRVLFGVEALGEQFSSPRIVGNRRQRGRGSMFVQETWAPFGTPKLLLVPGVRLDLDSIFGAVLTPRLAVRFDPVSSLALRIAFGTGFRAPSFQELYLDFENAGAGYRIDGNALLKPETSLGLTASADWAPRPFLAVSGSLFWNELTNMIAFDSVVTGADLRFTYANLARARTRGAEAMVTLNSDFGLNWSVGATVVDARDLSLNRPIDNQASVRGVTQVRWRVREWGLTFFARASWTSARPLTDGEEMTRYTSPFSFVDARVAKTLFGRFEVFVAGNNLLGAGNADDLLIPPRGGFAGVSFTY
jgi:outer membrane receptor for ferrienterochelin and colicins